MPNIFMRFPQGKKKALTLSYDDGVEQDKRLVSIMKQNGLKGTFNLNSGLYAAEGTAYPPGAIRRRMTEKEATELYAGSGMEVAAHGLTHAAYNMFPHNLCLAEVVKDRENLEKQFQTIVRGMAYPNGVYNDEAIDIIMRTGIVYARTTKSRYDFQIPSDWLRLQPTCHHKDQKLMEFAAKFVESDVEWGPWLFYLWGHSYEFEEDNNWDVIENFAEYIGSRDSIWYATNIEIFDYVDAYKRLIFSMDGMRVYNPTATDLYFETNHETVFVKAGEEKVM